MTVLNIDKGCSRKEQMEVYPEGWDDSREWEGLLICQVQWVSGILSELNW